MGTLLDPGSTIEKHLERIPLARTVLLGLFFGIYTDFFNDTVIAQAVAFFLFGIVIAWALLKDFAEALKLFLIFMLLSPLVNRDMVRIRQMTGTDGTVNGLMTTQFLSFTLVQWGFIFFGLLGITLHFIKHRNFPFPPGIRPLFYLNLAVLISMSLATTIDALAAREFINFRFIVSDMRFFIIVFFATFTALYFLDRPLLGRKIIEQALLTSALAGGVKALFFLAHDFLAHRTSLYFSPQPYVFFPVFFAVLFAWRSRITWAFAMTLLLVFLAAFSISRGDIFFALVNMLIFLTLLLGTPSPPRFRFKAFNTMISFVLVVSAVTIAGLFLTNPSAFKFLLFKTSFFIKLASGQEIGESASIRYYEMKNILAESLERIYPIFIGKGAGAYFSYIRHPIPFSLGPGSYSESAIEIQRYVAPHGFAQYCYLKGGLFFLSYYIGILTWAFWQSFRFLRNKLQERSLLICMLPFFSVFAVNMFWRPPIIFLFFLIFNIILLERGKLRTAQ
jgi:hypothetical protein